MLMKILSIELVFIVISFGVLDEIGLSIYLTVSGTYSITSKTMFANIASFTYNTKV